MRGKVKIFGLIRTLSGPSHHNMENQDSCRRGSCRRDSCCRSKVNRFRRMICRHRECNPTSRRTMGALRPRNIHCSTGCCRHLGCKLMIRVHNRVQRRKRLGCKLPNIRVHHIRDQSSKFHASRSFSHLRQQRRQKRPAQRRTMQSKLSTKNF